MRLSAPWERRANTATLFSQFGCHWWVVLTSQPLRGFHLEVFRPNYGMLGDITYNCNPVRQPRR
jgi:hypothetical protein